MRIIDGANDIGFCFENGKFSKRRWDAYIENLYPGLKSLVEADAASYDYSHEILPVLNAIYSKQDKLERMNRSFCKATDNLEERIRNTLHTEMNADIVLYLGLCNGAGWATKINDKPTVLLGIEKIVELDWVDEVSMTALIYHELGHLWHFQERALRTNVDTAEDRALWQLYSEGVAMYCEQLLCGDDRFFHQNQNGWLEWCTENKKRLFNEYAFRMKNGESIQDFFGDWRSFEGRSDTGYFLGAELVRKAAEEHSLQEVLNLSLDEVEQFLLMCAK